MSVDTATKTAPGWDRSRAGTCFAIGAALVGLVTRDAWAVAAAPATKLVNVADTRAMAPGPGKWIADLYNSNYWLYGLIVVVTMAAMGLILGMGFDRLMSLIGINLGRLEHQE
jgi:hypothetical protein